MRAPAPPRLPRGRHRLPREEVVRSQRERMLRALAQTMAEKGYVATTVTDVLRRAGVSRETFYEQFRSKEDCFAQAYDAAAGILLSGVAQAGAGADADAGAPLERFDHVLRAYLDTLAAESEFARLFLVEVYAAGADAIARRGAAQQAFAHALGEQFGARTDADRFACEAFVAATGAMVTARLAAGDVDGLRELHGPLLRFAGDLFSGF